MAGKNGELLPIQVQAKSLQAWLYQDNIQDQLEKALTGTGVTWERFLRTFWTALLKTPSLLQCSRESILGCMITGAQLALEPVLDKAALIPYKGKATFQVMYRGILELAWRTDKIKITADVIHENDEYDITSGDEEHIFHKPKIPGPGEGIEVRGAPIGAYTVWTWMDGRKTMKFMPEYEIIEVRDKYSQGYQKSDSAWVKRPLEMWKKTVIKNHAKTQPCSHQLQTAVALDNRAETGMAQDDLFADLKGEPMDITAMTIEEEKTTPEPEPPEEPVGGFDKWVEDAAKACNSNPRLIKGFLDFVATTYGKSREEVIASANQEGEFERFKVGFSKDWKGKAEIQAELDAKNPFVGDNEPTPEGESLSDEPPPPGDEDGPQKSMFADEGPRPDEFESTLQFYNEELPKKTFDKIMKATGCDPTNLGSVRPEDYGTIIRMLGEALDKGNS